MNPAAREIRLNVCGLQPPEPMERVLDALNAMTRGGELRVLIDRKPLPLYDLLTRRGYEFSVDEFGDGRREIRIRHAR